MTPSQLNPDTAPRPQDLRCKHQHSTQARHDFHNPDHGFTSQRHFVQHTGVPRTTLQHGMQQASHPDLEPQLVAFFESPVGYCFLRRLLLALHLDFHLAGPADIRLICHFLEHTQLDRFVAPSFGSQQALAVHLQTLLIAYADQEKQRLAATMSARKSPSASMKPSTARRPVW